MEGEIELVALQCVPVAVVEGMQQRLDFATKQSAQCQLPVVNGEPAAKCITVSSAANAEHAA
jgi:hypothetical protein